MATPTRSSWNACLYDWAGITVRNAIRENLDPARHTILDIGAGWGKTALLLPEFESIDAVEIWRPYVEDPKLHLRELYRRVFIDDAEQHLLHSPDYYSAITILDTLEHMWPEKAQHVISMASQLCDHIFVVVPWTMEQEEVDGNPHEAHRQDDLTPDIMEERYPQLRLDASTEVKGLYTLRRGT